MLSLACIYMETHYTGNTYMSNLLDLNTILEKQGSQGAHRSFCPQVIWPWSYSVYNLYCELLDMYAVLITCNLRAMPTTSWSGGLYL